MNALLCSDSVATTPLLTTTPKPSPRPLSCPSRVTRVGPSLTSGTFHSLCPDNVFECCSSLFAFCNCLGSQRVHSLLQSDNQPRLPNYTVGGFLLSIHTLPISRVSDMFSCRVCHPPKLNKFPINKFVGWCSWSCRVLHLIPLIIWNNEFHKPQRNK